MVLMAFPLVTEPVYAYAPSWGTPPVTDLEAIPGKSTHALYDAANKVLTIRGVGQIDRAKWDDLMASCWNTPGTWGTAGQTEDFKIVFEHHPSETIKAPANCSGMFKYFNGQIDFGPNGDDLDTSEVTDMSNMFWGCDNFNSPINFDTSNVEDMSMMFAGAKIFDQELNFDTSKVKDMSGMFSGAAKFNQTLGFDTSAVENMEDMFSMAWAFNNGGQPLKLTTDKVKKMSNMFSNAKAIKVPFEFTDTSAVETFEFFLAHTEYNQPLDFNFKNVQSFSGFLWNNSEYSHAIDFMNGKTATDPKIMAMNSVLQDATSYSADFEIDASGMTAYSYVEFLQAFLNTKIKRIKITANPATDLMSTDAFDGCDKLEDLEFEGLNFDNFDPSHINNLPTFGGDYAVIKYSTPIGGADTVVAGFPVFQTRDQGYTFDDNEHYRIVLQDQKLIFNSENDGRGTTHTQLVKILTNADLDARAAMGEAFKKPENVNFLGWSDTKDDPTVDYTDAQTAAFEMPLETVELYAVWVDKRALADEVADEDSVKASDEYVYDTEADKAAYRDALDAAKTVLNKADATQAEVDAALSALQTARAALDGVGPDVIKESDLPDDTTPSNKYVKVTFKPGENGSLEGETVYYVRKAAAFTLGDLNPFKPTIVPADGYAANGWSEDDETPIGDDGDLEVTAKYIGLADIIKGSDLPEGTTPGALYAKVSFAAGEHGSLTGETVYYVRKLANLTFGDLPKPTIVPDAGYAANGWSEDDETPIGDDGLAVEAKYNLLPDIIKGSELPEGTTPGALYAKVSFAAGAHGSLTGETVYYVRKLANLTFGDLPKPTIVPDAGYTGKGWNALASTPINGDDLNVKALYRRLTTDDGDDDFTPSGGGSTSTGGGNAAVDTTPVEVTVEETAYPIPAIFTKDHYAYVTGYPDGTVRPLANITRAEVSTIFFRLLIDQVRADNWTQDNNYSDVNIQLWFNNAVSVMSKMTKIMGYPDGEFKGNEPITRAELAAIVSRFADTIGETQASSRLFSDTAAHWGELLIDKAAGIGWIKGYPDGSFRPDQNTTRAEFMAVVNRILHRAPENDAALHAGMTVWPDNMDRSAWYYLDVQEATNSHNYKQVEKLVPQFGFKYETWTQMVPNRDWTKLEKEWSELSDNLQ